jgi:hypothetical protein
MNFQELLGIYIDKFGEDYAFDTVTLSEEVEQTLYDMLKKSISINEPIPHKELNEILGYDPNNPNILI